MVKFYENITQDTQHLVKELNNKMKNGKPCALTVYHPYCGHCMDMKPTWKAMGEHMEKKYDDDLYIAFIHMDVANEFPIDQYKIQGYPHIIYTANNNEVEYSGPRNENAFESWILENLKQTNNENNINKNVNTTVLPSSKNNKNNNEDMIISTLTKNSNFDTNSRINSPNNSYNSRNNNNLNVRSHPFNNVENSTQLYRKLLTKHNEKKNTMNTMNTINSNNSSKQVTSKPKKRTTNNKSTKKMSVKISKKPTLSRKSKKSIQRKTTKSSKKLSTKSKRPKSSKKPKS